MYITMLRNKIAELIAKRNAAVDKLDLLAGTLTTEKRDATPEEDAEVTALDAEARTAHAEIVDLQADLAQREAIDEARKSAPKPPPVGQPGHAGGSGDDPYDIDLRSSPRNRETIREIDDRAKRALEAELDLDDDQKAHVDRQLRSRKVNRGGALARHILATGRPAYRDAFAELATRANPMLTAEQMDAVQEVRGLQITADASGGFLMPFTLDPTIIDISTGVVNPVRQLATVINVSTDNWQGVTSAGVTASYDPEESEVSDDTPVFAQPVIAIHQAQAFVPFSVQAEDDLGNLTSDASAMFSDAKDRLEGTVFTLGTGAGQPFGFITEAATTAAAVADAYAVGDVYALRASVQPRYRVGGVFMSALEIADLTRQFATGAGPQHAFWTDLSGDSPSQLIGKAWYENSAMDAAIAPGVNLIMAFGDFKMYHIHDRIGMTVELVPHLFGVNRRPTGQRGWYARWRNGARLLDPNAIKVLNV